MGHAKTMSTITVELTIKVKNRFTPSNAETTTWIHLTPSGKFSHSDFFSLECGRFSSEARSLILNIKIYKLGNQVPKSVQGKVARQETRTRWHRVEMHFPGPEVRIYSRKTKTNNQSKNSRKTEPAGPNTNKTSKATCAVRTLAVPHCNKRIICTGILPMCKL